MREKAVDKNNKGQEFARDMQKPIALLSLLELQVVFHTIPCGVLLVNAKGQIVSLNSITERLFDYSSKQLIGQSFTMLMPERYRAMSKKYVKQFFSTPTFRQLGEGQDFWGLSRNGRETRVKVGLNVMQIREGVMAMILLLPVSTQRMMEESFGYGVLEHSEDHVAVVNHNYRYEYVNAVYERVHGLSRSEILGKRVADLLGPAVFEKIVKPYFDRCLSGERVVYQYGFHFRGHGFRTMEVTYLPMHVQGGPVDRVMVHSRDMTEFLRLEQSILAIQEVLSGNKVLESSQQRELPQNLSPGGSKIIYSDLMKLGQLTPQKKAILAYVAQGKTNKEIAVLLNISDKTVRNHLTSIFRKLHITRRPEAASIFIRAAFEGAGEVP